MIDTELKVVNHSQYISNNLISSHSIFIPENSYLISKHAGENGSEATTRKLESHFANLHVSTLSVPEKTFKIFFDLLYKINGS